MQININKWINVLKEILITNLVGKELKVMQILIKNNNNFN